MTLRPACRFAVAPHFHLAVDWPRRLLLAEGGGWRTPTHEEQTALVGGPAGCVCLFCLPGHLGAEWWGLLDRGADGLADVRLPGFEGFVGQVVEFLAFKGLNVPEGARCDVVVSDAASLVQRPDETLWGEVNLGDEPTSVVLPGEPAVRLLLGPGEGYHRPPSAPPLEPYLADKQEPDVRLRITAPGT